MLENVMVFYLDINGNVKFVNTDLPKEGAQRVLTLPEDAFLLGLWGSDSVPGAMSFLGQQYLNPLEFYFFAQKIFPKGHLSPTDYRRKGSVMEFNV